MTEPRPLSPRTVAAQALGRIDESTRAIVPPIHLSTTFERDPDNLYRSGNIYGRPDNETVREAEAVIGALEGAAARRSCSGASHCDRVTAFKSAHPRRPGLGPHR